MEALAKLPPAEREAWGKLWNKVALLLAGLKREEPQMDTDKRK